MQLWRRDRAAGSSTPRTPRWLSRCASLTAATAAAAAAPPAAAAAAPAPESPADGESAPAGPPQRILVSEVDVRGVTGELAAAAHAALTIRPDFAYTLEEVQARQLPRRTPYEAKRAPISR